MNPNFYKYCILKYKHTPFLDESINIGLLVYFSCERKFSFTYSKNLSRIKNIYNDVPEKTIREYLKQIDRVVQKFTFKEDFFQGIEINNFTDFISKNLLTVDSSVLSFSNCRTELQYEFKNEFINNILLNKYFIEDIKVPYNQSREPELAKKFYDNLKDLNFELINKNEKKFYVDYTLVNETGNPFKFDYAWQNGTLNLVKPISFDLKESKSIAEKAYKNLGQFIDLQDEAIKKGLRYDLILGRPKNRSLYKEYDHATKLLEKLKHVELIEETGIKKYSEKAIIAITK
jgi:Protein of unknown function (DUF3037)